MKVAMYFKTKNRAIITEHFITIKNWKGWTFENKGNVLKVQDGNKILKFKNCIFESIDEEIVYG